MNNITKGQKVWARINGRKVAATVLDWAFSAEGDYLQCKLEVEQENPLAPGQVLKQVYPRPIQSYRLTRRIDETEGGEKPIIRRSKPQSSAEVLKDIESLIRQN